MKITKSMKGIVLMSFSLTFFNGQNPVITAVVIALGTVNYYCTFLLTMLKRPYMVSCKPLAAPDSKPLINANCF